jgi:hypothetical protein
MRKFPEIIQDHPVDKIFIEGIVRKTIFMRIADGKLSPAILRYHDMDAPLEIVGHFRGITFAQGGQGSGHFKTVVVDERKTAAKGGTDAPAVGLGNHAHHLQFAFGNRQPGEMFRIKRFKVGAITDKDHVRLVLFLIADIDGLIGNIRHAFPPIEST